MLNAKELVNGRFGKLSNVEGYAERFGKFHNVEVYAICKKLRELGVEKIEVYSDKIEFYYDEHLCTCKDFSWFCNGFIRFTCGDNILVCDFDTLTVENLNRLVGLIIITDEQLTREQREQLTSVGSILDLFEDKYNHLLTDEQLTRVGYILDLFEDKYNHLLSQQEDMEYVGMSNTDFYKKHIICMGKCSFMINILQNAFQTGKLGVIKSRNVKNYILNGE